jgi:hypothetical protein
VLARKLLVALEVYLRTGTVPEGRHDARLTSCLAIVAIGFASNLGSPSSADVAQEALDATQPPGRRRIVVTTHSRRRPARSDALLRDVDRATILARDPAVVAVVGSVTVLGAIANTWRRAATRRVR